MRLVRGLSKCGLGLGKLQMGVCSKKSARVGSECPKARGVSPLLIDARVFFHFRVAWLVRVCTGLGLLGASAGAAGGLALIGLWENVSKWVRWLFNIMLYYQTQRCPCAVACFDNSPLC